MIEQNHAPPTCRQCGHVVLVTLTRGERAEHYDRCGHPSGPHPMWEPCAWRAEKREGKKG